MILNVRTLFISDVHLGTRGCQAHELLDFLKNCEAETIYLIGDIVDGWRLKSTWYWPQAHNDVVQKMLRRRTAASGSPWRQVRHCHAQYQMARAPWRLGL